MSANHYQLIYRLLNIWLGFFVLIIFTSYLPHWENVKFLTWIVYAIKFWFFLCVLNIAKRECYNKDIFINLSILFLIDIIGFVNIFIGDNYLFGNNSLAYFIYQYHTIIYHFFLSFSILFIIIKLTFLSIKRLMHYLITFIILMLAIGIIFSPYFIAPTHAFLSKNGFLSDLFKRTFQLNIFTLLCTIYYGFFIYRNNRILGEYINLLVSYFFIYLFADLIENLSMVYQFQSYNIRLYIITFNFIFLSFILFKKLIYTYSDFGQFYESLLAGQYSFSKVKIIPRNQNSNTLALKVIKIYIHQRRQYLLTLLVLLGVGVFFFELPACFTFNLVALIFGFSIILIFYDALYKKRGQQKVYL